MRGGGRESAELPEAIFWLCEGRNRAPEMSGIIDAEKEGLGTRP